MGISWYVQTREDEQRLRQSLAHETRRIERRGRWGNIAFVVLAYATIILGAYYLTAIL